MAAVCHALHKVCLVKFNFLKLGLNFMNFFLCLNVVGNGPLDENEECTSNATIWMEGTEKRCPEKNAMVVLMMVVYMLLTNILLVNLLIAMFRCVENLWY
jgi:hypothetical protein